jgi:hypothetical protein
MAFGTQQSGGDKNLYPSGGDVVDKAGDEKSPGQQRIRPSARRHRGHGLMRVGDGHGVEFWSGRRRSTSRAAPGNHAEKIAALFYWSSARFAKRVIKDGWTLLRDCIFALRLGNPGQRL